MTVVFIGGGIGSLLRYGVQTVWRSHHPLPYTFPWSTFIVNIAGSFLIGLFYALAMRFHISPKICLLLTTGLCGGFTTFSTFSNDGMLLLKQGDIVTFMLYAVLSMVFGLAAVFAGNWCGR